MSEADFPASPKELSAADKMWKLFQNLRDMNITYEKQVASQSFQKTNYRLSIIPGHKEWDYSEDILTDQKKMKWRVKVNLGTPQQKYISVWQKKIPEDTLWVFLMSRFTFGRTSNLSLSYSMSSLVEVNLENSSCVKIYLIPLTKNLQREQAETKVGATAWGCREVGSRGDSCGFKNFSRLLPPGPAKGEQWVLLTAGLGACFLRAGSLRTLHQWGEWWGLAAPLLPAPGKRRRASVPHTCQFTKYHQSEAARDKPLRQKKARSKTLKIDLSRTQRH